MEMYHVNEMTFNDKVVYIISALKEAGYDPYVQLTGYLQTGNEGFITRHGGARTIIQELDREQLKQFVSQYFLQGK